MNSIKGEEWQWGRFFVKQCELTYKLKQIDVDLLGRLSYQFHQKCSEVLTILNDVGPIILDRVLKDYSKEEIILIIKGVKRRIENKSSEKVIFIEAQTVTYFVEDDIVRIEDNYNRA